MKILKTSSAKNYEKKQRKASNKSIKRCQDAYDNMVEMI